MIWQSEAFLYGMMFANLFAVGGALLWAWRRGHLSDLEAAGNVLFDDEAEGPSGQTLAPRGENHER